MISLQLHQLLTLTAILAIGFLYESIYLDAHYFVIFSIYATILTLMLNRARGVKLYIPYSSATTAIGISILLASSSLVVYFVVITIAILQKYLLRVKSKHIFNPSNFGVVVAIVVLSGYSYPISGQLGDNIYTILVVSVLGLGVLVRANRVAVAVSFLLFYLIFSDLFFSAIDPTMGKDMVYKQILTMEFALFLLFMITDPKTSPEPIWMQILFGLVINISLFGLHYIFGYRFWHTFLALFITTVVFAIPNIKTKKDFLKISLLVVAISAGMAYLKLHPPQYLFMGYRL